MPRDTMSVISVVTVKLQMDPAEEASMSEVPTALPTEVQVARAE